MFCFLTKGVITLLVTKWKIEVELTATALVLICTKKIQIWTRNGWVMAIFPLRGCVIPLRTTWDKRGCLGIHLYQKYPKLVKIWLSYCHFSLKGCVILLKITWDKSGSFRFIFTKNIQKSLKKWLILGYWGSWWVIWDGGGWFRVFH